MSKKEIQDVTASLADAKEIRCYSSVRLFSPESDGILTLKINKKQNRRLFVVHNIVSLHSQLALTRV